MNWRRRSAGSRSRHDQTRPSISSSTRTRLLAWTRRPAASSACELGPASASRCRIANWTDAAELVERGSERAVGGPGEPRQQQAAALLRRMRPFPTRSGGQSGPIHSGSGDVLDRDLDVHAPRSLSTQTVMMYICQASNPAGTTSDHTSRDTQSERSNVTDLLLIPLDDTVLFPGMTVTIAADTGDEERVLVVPRVDGDYAEVGTIAEVLETGLLPGGIHAATVRGTQRATPGAATTGSDGLLRVTATPHNDPAPDTERVDRARAQLPGRRRGDPRAARRRRAHPRLPALDLGPGRARRHLRLLPRPQLRAEARDPDDAPDRRAARARARDAARAARRAPGPPPDPRRRHRGRRGAAARVLPAQADGVDPQGAGRGRGQRDRGVPRQDRGRRDARRGPRAGRARARAARARRRAERRVLDDPHLPRLAAVRAVERALGGGPRPGPRPRGRSTPTTPASTTSRSGSPSTSRSASCGSTAASTRPATAARS